MPVILPQSWDGIDAPGGGSLVLCCGVSRLEQLMHRWILRPRGWLSICGRAVWWGERGSVSFRPGIKT